MSPTLLVSEIYKSLQGESSYVGLPCAFVRLAGCNLRCVWCDSAFSFHDGERLSIDQILAQVEALATPLVEVTGGEPLLQKPVHALFEELLRRGKTVLLETSGSLDVGSVDPRVVKIIDIKCPASGELHANRWENLAKLGARDEIKFVVADRADYEWAREIIRTRLGETRAGVLLGVVHGALEPRELAGWMLEDGLAARFQLQLHKQLWPPDARGV